MISSGSCFKDADTGRNHDMTRLEFAYRVLLTATMISIMLPLTLLDDTDDFWLKFMQEEGATYDSAKYSQTRVSSKMRF